MIDDNTSLFYRVYGILNAYIFFSHVWTFYICYLGFRISKTSCCNVDTTVGGLCLPTSRLCSNRSEYVFWDAYHPTDAANAVIAGLLFADPDIPQAPSPAPSPLWRAATYSFPPLATDFRFHRSLFTRILKDAFDRYKGENQRGTGVHEWLVDAYTLFLQKRKERLNACVLWNFY